jgi:hypothetical protein
MRSLNPLAVPALLVALTLPVCAAGIDDKPPDQQSINALQSKARLAPPREQCFLYAELAHQMTEYSLRQYAAGNVEQASDLLHQVQQMVHKVHNSLGDDNKRLKNAEILLRHTAFRLNEMLRSSSVDDQPLVQETLAQVNEAQTQAMLQVFRK